MKLIFVSLLFVVCGIYGWGEMGHDIVAQIAWNQLTTKTKNDLNVLLAGKTLVDVSTIADTYRSTAKGAWSDAMHYVNLARGSTKFNMDECGSLCVVLAVRNYTSLLSQQKNNLSPCQYGSGIEPCPLIFLTHFMGDLHQPLHVSYADDRGGNAVNVMWFTSRTNLHTTWDTKIIQKWTSSLDDAITELTDFMKKNPKIVADFKSKLSPSFAAEESFDLVLNTVYDYEIKNGLPYLGDAYFEKNLPLLQMRLIGGGVRLGAVLNNIFDPQARNVEIDNNGKSAQKEGGSKQTLLQYLRSILY